MNELHRSRRRLWLSLLGLGIALGIVWCVLIPGTAHHTIMTVWVYASVLFIPLLVAFLLVSFVMFLRHAGK